MGKFSFIAGAGLGYLFGTRAGRAQYERIKKVGNAVWENPSVQSRVQKVEHKVGDLARERTAAVTDMVANTVKERIRGGGNGVKPAGTTGTTGTTGSDVDERTTT